MRKYYAFKSRCSKTLFPATVNSRHVSSPLWIETTRKDPPSTRAKTWAASLARSDTSSGLILQSKNTFRRRSFESGASDCAICI